MKAITLLVVLACCLGMINTLKVSEIPRKKLAGPPSEFAVHQLPTPLNGALKEDSAYFEFSLAPKVNKHGVKNENKYFWKSDILVDSSEEFAVTFFSPFSEELKVKLLDPTGEQVDLTAHTFKGEFPIGTQGIPETTYRFQNPAVGTWTLKVSTTDSTTAATFAKIRATASSHGAVIVYNKSPTLLYTHLNTYKSFLGGQVGLVTAVTEDAVILEGVRPNALKDVVSEAEMDIIMPDGNSVDVQMHDDGLHGDLGANDGIYGAQVEASEEGTYIAKATVRGYNSAGTPFLRTTQHLISVVKDQFELETVAISQSKDQDRITIYVSVNAPVDSEKLYRSYAEVYGVDASNQEVAICWIGGMVPVESFNGQSVIALELNLNWIALANAKAPLTLKNVVVQDTESFLPLSESAEIPVKSDGLLTLTMNTLNRVVKEITPEMRKGIRPVRSNSTADVGKLVAVHGYCSGSNPWQPDSHIFDNAVYFLNANANLGNQDFSAKVYEFAQTHSETYSVVGHSQGGMVGLHLLNYFDTGLDYAEGGRKIQSVGTPYKGCSAAGSAASLGKVFGVGCGANDDLSTDGAKLWLAGITTDSQKEVYYYTTTYEQGKFFGDYCNMAINALLEWPNDGTTELVNAKLPYGNNMGNTEKQCHTTGMSYMAQYDDANRNEVINQNAAR